MDPKKQDSPFGTGINQGTASVHYGIATPPPPPSPPGQQTIQHTSVKSEDVQSDERDFNSLSPQEQIASRLSRIEDRLTRIEAVIRGHYGTEVASGK